MAVIPSSWSSVGDLPSSHPTSGGFEPSSLVRETPASKRCAHSKTFAPASPKAWSVSMALRLP